MALFAAPATAQVTVGVTEDALVVPRGIVRLEIGGSWRTWRDRYSSGPDGEPLGTRVSLGAEFSATPFGVDQAPSLLPVRSALRELTGDEALDISLGAVRTRADALAARTVFRLQLGLGARFALLASVPYVQTRMSVSTDVDASNANLGLNPAFLATDAASRNAALTAAARQASAELAALLATCGATPDAPGCAPIVANPDAARALAAEAERLATHLTTLYGSDDDLGADFVPIAGSATSDRIVSQITSVAERLAGYGIQVLPTDAQPVGAAPLTPAHLDLTGVGAAGQVERYGIGDVEVGGKLLLLDTFGPLPRATRPRGLNLRLAVGGVFRYGRESADSVSTPLDIGIGDGQNDIEWRGWLDLGFGSRVVVSTAARYGVQLADEPVLALPGTEPGVVERDLGDYLELEVSPRVSLGRSLAIAGFWELRRKDEDRVSGTLTSFDGQPVDAAALAVGTEARAQRAGVGLVLSTLDGYGQRLTDLPFDVSYLYTRTISGAGRLTPVSAEHRIAGRVYLRALGSARTR